MQIRVTVALAFVVALSASLAVRAQATENAPPEHNYTVTSDVTYTQGAVGPLKADVYIPKGAGPFPGIVFIHGGGWRNGDRNQMIKLIQALAEAGYVGFTIEYDVDPVHFPASFHESLAAVKFFRAHAKEYRLDTKRVAVMGSSAGGELAALVALDPEGAAFDNATGQDLGMGSDTRVQAAVIMNGALDLTVALKAPPTAGSSVTDYLGGTCADMVRECKDASPQYHVHAGAPPFYVGHGTADQMVPFAEAVAFTDALQKAGVPVKFFQAEGAKHTYWADPKFYAENLEGIKKFLGEHLKRK